MYRVELYARVRRACHVEGKSIREAARVFGVDRRTVAKMLAYAVPPGYRRSKPRARPRLDPYIGVIDRIQVRLVEETMRRPPCWVVELLAVSPDAQLLPSAGRQDRARGREIAEDDSGGISEP